MNFFSGARLFVNGCDRGRCSIKAWAGIERFMLGLYEEGLGAFFRKVKRLLEFKNCQSRGKLDILDIEWLDDV